MNRRADHQTVAGLHPIQRGVHQIILEDAAASAVFGAAAAADAAANRPVADPQRFRFDAALLERAGDLAERGVGAAVFVGAAVEQKNLHAHSSRCFFHYTSLQIRPQEAESDKCFANLRDMA